jgi:histidyl-tRNA synthetase
MAELGGERSLKAQMRTANRYGARLALIQGDQEIAGGIVTCKHMLLPEQEQRPWEAAVRWARERVVQSGDPAVDKPQGER